MQSEPVTELVPKNSPNSERMFISISFNQQVCFYSIKYNLIKIFVCCNSFKNAFFKCTITIPHREEKENKEGSKN